MQLLHIFQLYLFDPKAMADGSPPNDRGCRACGKIGVSMVLISLIAKTCTKFRLNILIYEFERCQIYFFNLASCKRLSKK